MSFFLDILLRALLCIGLVLNGSSYAVAAVPPGGGHPAAAAASQGDTDGATCTGHVAASHPTQHHAAVPPEVGASMEPHSPDCCDPATCRHICHSASPAVTLVPLLVAPAAGRDRPAVAFEVGHFSPSLARLNRPPIH